MLNASIILPVQQFKQVWLCHALAYIVFARTLLAVNCIWAGCYLTLFSWLCFHGLEMAFNCMLTFSDMCSKHGMRQQAALYYVIYIATQ